jgi:hypothetical protein
MVHGRDRDEVKRQVTAIVESCGLQDIQYSILFSTRRFKQRGANYATTINTEEPAGQIKLTLAEDEG